MTAEEAVRACEFWTTSLGGNIAIGSTSNPEIGLFFNGEEFQHEAWTNPSRRGWSIKVPRSVTGKENLAYQLVLKEIERRK